MTPAPSRVCLHIGEPKTGTTFLQHVLWRNREKLARAGVVLPGRDLQAQFRAAQDLREVDQDADDPSGSWAGEWDVLARQARTSSGTAVISHELISAVDADQARRAIRSLQPADVHLVLTVRDMASLIPAEWQESVKHRTTREWDSWLSGVIDVESVAADRREYWFWRVHDTLAVLDLWARWLPERNVHVITCPPKGSDTALLWGRFASVLGVPPSVADASRARDNASLGVAETEFLRRLNLALADEVPQWFYARNVKGVLAHGVLAARPRGAALLLPAEREAWATDYAAILAAGLRERAFDIVGDLDDLLPPVRAASGVRPHEVSSDELLAPAVEAAAALILMSYRRGTALPPATTRHVLSPTSLRRVFDQARYAISNRSSRASPRTLSPRFGAGQDASTDR